MENVPQQIGQHILLELVQLVAVVVEVVVAAVAVVERNSLVAVVLAVANNKIAVDIAIVVAKEEAVAVVVADSLRSFQHSDQPMMTQQVEVEEEPFPVEGGGSEHWCWLDP